MTGLCTAARAVAMPAVLTMEELKVARKVAQELHRKYALEVLEARTRLKQLTALKRQAGKVLARATNRVATLGVKSFVLRKVKHAKRTPTPVAVATPVDKNTGCVQCKFLWGVFRGGKGRGGKGHTCEKWYRVAQAEKRAKERSRLMALGKWPPPVAN